MTFGWYLVYMRWFELVLFSLIVLRFFLFFFVLLYDLRVVCCGVGGWIFNIGIFGVNIERMWLINRLYSLI